MKHSGKIAILTIGFVAVGLAVVAWVVRYQQGRRAMAFWGPEAAILIRHAPEVELLQLEVSTTDADQPRLQEKEIAGRKHLVVRQQDISEARGLVHARHSLILDSSFDWEGGQEACRPRWDYVLRFRRGDQQAEVAFDFQCGKALLVSENRQVHLSEKLKRGMRGYLERLRSPPDKENAEPTNASKQ